MNKYFLFIVLLFGSFTIGSSQPVWYWLAEMPQEQRENSKIEIMLEQNASNQALLMTQNIESLWNSCEYKQALALFPELEILTDINEMMIANRWLRPVPTKQPDWGTDVLISGRNSVYDHAFDIQHSSGNLFAAVLSGYGSYNIVCVYISTDGGSNWSETFAINTGDVDRCVSGVVLCGHFYVTYPVGSDKKNARIRRFKCSDAQPDTFSNGGYFRPIYTASQPIDEGILVSNEDIGGNRLHYLALEHAGVLKHFVDDTTCASWTEYNTNVTNASIGLDACYNAYWSTYYLFVSYIDNGQDLNVIGRHSSGWSIVAGFNNCGTYAQATAISAYHDTILCVFEYNDSLRCLESCQGGTNWHWGYIEYNPTAAHRRADVACRRGGGQAVVYNWLSPRELRYRWQDYSGSWSAPVEIADSSSHTLCKPSIEYLGAGVYGVVYAGMMDSYGYVAYFDRSNWTGINENTFDNIDLYVMSITPNPSIRGNVDLSFFVINQGIVSILLFDASGRVVKTLLNEIKQSGEYTITMNIDNFVSGIYFVCLETKDGTETQTLTIVR